MLRQDRRSETHQDFGDCGGGAPAVPVQAVEYRIGAEDRDHVFGLADRAAGSEAVGRQQHLGEAALEDAVAGGGGGQVP